jgi:GNAT superfamily N-acetyltransferase
VSRRGAGATGTNAGAFEIQRLTPATWPALAELFAAGGDPKWCWCQFWRKPGSNWTNTSPEENRRDLEALAPGDPAPGLVALRDGRAIGWVGLGPREAFPRLERSRTIPTLPGDGVWSINCFVVARSERRSGIAGALLEAAVAYAAAHGASLVEGYPVRTEGGRVPSASVYTGTAGMFERAGFDVAAETTSKASGGSRRVVMRRPAMPP